MLHYRYLIVGGGMAADAAIHGIREIDSCGPIGLIGAETDCPYRALIRQPGPLHADDLKGRLPA